MCVGCVTKYLYMICDKNEMYDNLENIKTVQIILKYKGWSRPKLKAKKWEGIFALANLRKTSAKLTFSKITKR